MLQPTAHHVNGKAVILNDRAQALAHYPHARKFNGTIHISGISSRNHDNSYEGVTQNADGTVTLDIKAQTHAVINNIKCMLHSCHADLKHLVDLTVYLVDMKDYAAFNEVYNEYFGKETGPSRTCVAVHQLPNPNLLIEIKAIAADPNAV